MNRPWPLADLLAAVNVSVKGLALCTGLSESTISGVVDRGLTDTQADRWAVLCGLHPASVWDGWFEAGLSPLDREFVEGGGWRQAWEWLETQAELDMEEAA